VEYDAILSVIHRHPLQNRAISPKMRVITRHSKLLYFLKHLPRWQFLGLSGIVTLESAIQGLWCRYQDRQEDARAWRTIRDVARRLRNGAELRGREVLALAESVAIPEHPSENEPPTASNAASESARTATTPLGSARMPRGARRSRTTLLKPRKDGPT